MAALAQNVFASWWGGDCSSKTSPAVFMAASRLPSCTLPMPLQPLLAPPEETLAACRLPWVAPTSKNRSIHSTTCFATRCETSWPSASRSSLDEQRYPNVGQPFVSTRCNALTGHHSEVPFKQALDGRLQAGSRQGRKQHTGWRRAKQLAGNSTGTRKYSCQAVPHPEARDENDDGGVPGWLAKVELGVVGAGVAAPLQEPASIHPTAVVHPDAVLCEGVSVGAYCVIGPGAVIGPGCTLHPYSSVAGDTTLGARCVLKSGAVLGEDILGKTVIGDDNVFGHQTVVGVKCQDLKYQEGDACFLTIGSRNDIREHASIHRSSRSDLKTVIGDDNLIMGSCHVAHDCSIGDHNILANATLLAGHVVMEKYAHTGGAVAVHQFCHIGSYAFLAGGSMVDRDVPTYMMVAGDRAELRGLNLEGLRRCGFTTEEVRNIRRAYQKLFMNSDEGGGSLEQRLVELEASDDLASDRAVSILIESIKGSFADKRRGICKFRHWTSL